MPEFLRASEEQHSRSKTFAKGSGRLAAVAQFFVQNELFLFKLMNAFFVRIDHGGRGRAHDPVQETGNLGIDAGDALLEACRCKLRLADPVIPDILEDVPAQVDEIAARLHVTEQFVELGFHVIAANGFAVAGATFAEAHIVRMLHALVSRRPA
ncbi:hypothetical protein [Parvularcula sp. LCG005]|uniref:hypothetical protein n=1 Tax=Parvularcula sp. LCG005 TaxID=3078805 RepID=UPI00294236AF|nr:hypothetical protein [Parvularcula sp. LCG005]WOI52569.1 hypothetical protein RUI03_10465 [Parvularcula sp. LCG005]